MFVVVEPVDLFPAFVRLRVVLRLLRFGMTVPRSQ